MKSVLTATKPKLYYGLQKVIEKVHPGGPGDCLQDKNDARMKSNKVAKEIVRAVIKDGYITREQIVDDIETWMRSLMALCTIDSAASLKY